MIYTEAQAYATRCTPMQVIRLIERERFDALAAMGEAQLQCIGSACAQWRWYDQANDYGETFQASGFTPGATMKGRASESVAHPIRLSARGFCGLAGRID